jgi:hypothetical protein
MDCTISTAALDGATLVSVVVANPHDEPARYRLENELDGPLWPPRRRGQPEAGWDETGYEGVLGPGERDSLGYAVPAEPAEPPARIAWTEPADPTDRASTSPGATVRSFRDPRPPRSVLSPPSPSQPADHPGGEWP